MRVLHFLDSVGRGGAEMQALDVCRNAARYGLDITLVAAGGGALEMDFRDSGVEFIRLERRLPVDLYLVSQLRKIIRERRIDIVHGYQAVDGLHLFIATRGLRNVKKVLSFQGFIPDLRNRIASKFLIPRMDANIVVSRGLQKWLAEQDGFDTDLNFNVIYNGADPNRLQPSGKSIRKELGLPGDALLMGMIGNFYRDPRKDQLTVCKALPAVFADCANAHFIFAGRTEAGAEGKFADCLDFCINHGLTERVHFLGARSDVPDILSELDVFVFSTLQEGLPVAVSEAMLAGVPMVLSDIEPLLEVSQDGEYAEIFPVKDHETLAAKMSELLSNESRRVQLAAKAKKFAAENFSIDSHMRNLTRLYDRLLKKNGEPH